MADSGPSDNPVIVLEMAADGTWTFSWGPSRDRVVDPGGGFGTYEVDGNTVTWLGGACDAGAKGITRDRWPAERPFVVLAPQHDDTADQADYSKPHRVYLTGISCGAFGAWEYVSEYGNEQVAAVVPIAGEGRPAWGAASCDLGKVAIWAFHGMADDTVNPKGSVKPLSTLQDCPTPPRREALLTTYPDAGHDSWTDTYKVGADDDIYSWMLGISNP